MSAALDAVVSRLEGVAARLEASEARFQTSGPAQFPSARSEDAANAPSQASSTATGSLQAWDSSVSLLVSSFKAASEALGSEVAKAGQVVESAFKAERNVVEAMTKCKKPDMAELQQLVTPVGTEIQAADKLTQGRRTDAFNHNKAVAEAVPALSWVVYSGPGCGMDLPAKHVDNTLQSAEFWANKVLLADRSAPSQEWVKALKELLKGLAAYVKQHHAAGPAWNPSGVPLSQYMPGAQPSSGDAKPQPASAPPAAKRGGPAPPPPMPAGGRGSLIKDAPKQAAAAGPPAGGMNALFSELNKGDTVTKGLKKVTDDMKTKNRADRSGVVSTAAGAQGSSADATASAAKPGRTVCEQGSKWMVENHVNNPEIIIAETSPKQAVYIYGCKNSTVQIKGKVNALTVDSCQRMGILFDDLVSSCELVNSIRVQVQVTGVVPIIAIDKCDGVQLYISQASLGADITTAKSSEVNVLVPGDTPDADLVEHAIPEQYVSQYKGGKYVTLPVSHSGG